jgi:hypothetical protein
MRLTFCLFAILAVSGCGSDQPDRSHLNDTTVEAQRAGRAEFSPLIACPDDDKTCVEMAIDTRDLQAVVLDTDSHDHAGYSVFRVRVRARSNDGPPEEVVLRVMGYAGGIECSAFGQAVVAVRGFSPEGEPILLGSDGSVLAIDTASLQVGCHDCALLVSRDGDESGPAATVPAWDLTLVDAHLEGVAYRDDGTIYIRQGERCVAIPRSGEVEAVDTDHCEQGVVIGDYMRPVEGLDLPPGRWVISSPSQRKNLVLRSEACT